MADVANYISILTPGQVQIIRGRYVARCRKNGAAAMAKVFGVCPSSIRKVVHGENHKDKPWGDSRIDRDTLVFIRQWVVPCSRERGWNTFARLLDVTPKVLRAMVADLDYACVLPKDHLSRRHVRYSPISSNEKKVRTNLTGSCA